MTPCDFEVLVGQYHDRELDEARAAEMAKHILECEPCAEHLASLRRMSGVIGRIPLDPLSQIEKARMYRVVDQLPRRAAEFAIIRMAGSLAALAASLLLVTSVWLVGAGNTPTSGGGNHPLGNLPNLAQVSDSANSNLSHWMVRNLGGDLP